MLKYEAGSFINSMQDISYIIVNGRFTIIGWYKCGVIINISIIR